MRRSRILALTLLTLVIAGALAFGAITVLRRSHDSSVAQASLAPTSRVPTATPRPDSTPAPSAAAGPASPRAALPRAILTPLLAALNGSPPGHFQSADITIHDAGGNPLTMHVVGGTVQVADSKEVAIIPNAGGNTLQFTVGPGTRVVDGPNRLNALDLTWSTPVVVLTQVHGTQAAAILALSVLGGPASAAATPSAARVRLPRIGSRIPTPTPRPSSS